MSNKRNRRNLFWITCFCADSRASILEEADEKLVRLIQKGNLQSIDRALRKIHRPTSEVNVVIKRRHLSTAYLCLVDHRSAGSDPFINFYQECSPVIWAVDCLQWHVLPLLTLHGFDINRPQTCRRWTYICAPSSRPNTAPYRRFWTRGRYTYQSALDYFFASVYELFGEQPSSYNGLSGPSPLAFYFSHLPILLTKGVDVHRIDSVIVFNNLATSFDQYLCRYTNEHATVPDIPENEDAFVELTAVERLIKNGFSEFECMDYLYPCCNWFGILMCLVCHPKIDSYGTRVLPAIIRQATLLLINMLTLRCTFPSEEEFNESLENLHLRKIYSKRYGEKREIFNSRLAHLHHICQGVVTDPMTLKVLARNVIRRQLGGIDFYRKTLALGLPPQLTSFVQYIGYEHLKASHIPKVLIGLVQGDVTEFTQSSSPELISTNSTVLDHMSTLPSVVVPSSNRFNFNELFPFDRRLRRGRASERHHVLVNRLIDLGRRHSFDFRIRSLSASLSILDS